MKFWLIFTGFFCKKWLNWATHKGTMVKKVTKRFGSKMYHFYNKISYSSNEVEILTDNEPFFAKKRLNSAQKDSR